MATKKNSLSDLKSKVVEHKTPVQKVVPVSTEKEQEVLFNAYIPVSLRDKLKMKSVRERIPMKDLLVDALKGYYNDLD